MPRPPPYPQHPPVAWSLPEPLSSPLGPAHLPLPCLPPQDGLPLSWSNSTPGSFVTDLSSWGALRPSLLAELLDLAARPLALPEMAPSLGSRLWTAVEGHSQGEEGVC